MCDRNYIESFSSDRSSSSKSIDYLAIRRIYALLATNEMIRNRGKFGPRAVEDLYASVEALPSIVGSIDNDSTADLIELEVFLDLLCSEMTRLQLYADLLLKEFLGVESIMSAKGLFRPEHDMDEKQLIDTWSKKLLGILSDLQVLLLSFMAFDDGRSGEVTFRCFCDILLQLDQAPKGSESNDLFLSIEFIASSFLDSNTSLVCYLDFVSLLVAYTVQNDLIDRLTLTVIVEALSIVKRGLDDALAQKLVTFIGYAQSIHSAGIFWPYKSPPISAGNSFGSMTLTGQGWQEPQFTLPINGEWNIKGNSTSDGPGNLKTEKCALSTAKLHNTHRAETIATEESIEPLALQSKREIANVFGEIAHVGGKVSGPNAILRAFELTEFITIGGNDDRCYNLEKATTLPPISTIERHSPITDDADSDSLPSIKESDVEGLRRSLLVSKQRAEGKMNLRLASINERDISEMSMRLGVLSQYESEAAERFRMEKERFEMRRKAKLRNEFERIRSDRVRQRIESRKSRDRERSRQMKRETVSSRVAALEEIERRRIALKEEDRIQRIQREKEQRELAKRQEEEMHRYLEKLRQQQDENRRMEEKQR